MIARKYTVKVEIWQSLEIPDGFGGYSQQDVFVKKVWSGVNSKGSGFKFQQFGLNDFKNPVIFAIRGKHNINFDEKTFVIYKGRRFEVKGVENVDLEGVELNLYCDGK